MKEDLEKKYTEELRQLRFKEGFLKLDTMKREELEALQKEILIVKRNLAKVKMENLSEKKKEGR